MVGECRRQLLGGCVDHVDAVAAQAGGDRPTIVAGPLGGGRVVHLRGVGPPRGEAVDPGIGDRGQDRGETEGHAESDVGGNNISLVWTADTVTLSTEVKADIAGIKGKVKTTVKMKTCPDAEGKVRAEFESVSSIATGGANANTRISSSVEASVDTSSR